LNRIKIIPQVFYDVISRIIPGCIVIVLGAIASGTSIGHLLSRTLEGSKALQDSIFISILLLLVASYLVGQALAPLSIFIERKLLAKIFPESFTCLQRSIDQGDSGFSPQVRQFLLEEIGGSESVSQLRRIQYYTTTLIWFDWVQIFHPDAGVRLAKTRAEYRMHGQNTVGLIVVLFLHVLTVTFGPLHFNLGLIAVLFTMICLSLWGETRMSQIFQWSIMHYYYVAKTSDIPDNRKDIDASRTQRGD